MPISQAQQRAVAKYSAAHYDTVNLRLKKGEREQMRLFAQSKGLSLNAFITNAAKAAMSTPVEEPTNTAPNIPPVAPTEKISTDTNTTTHTIPAEDTAPPVSDLAAPVEGSPNDTNTTQCLYCGTAISGRRTKKFCSDRCRVNNHKRTKKGA